MANIGYMLKYYTGIIHTKQLQVLFNTYVTFAQNLYVFHPQLATSDCLVALKKKYIHINSLCISSRKICLIKFKIQKSVTTQSS